MQTQAPEQTEAGTKSAHTVGTSNAHYCDPCLYCCTRHDDVAPGPCPAREAVEPGYRQLYCLSEADKAEIVKAIQTASSTPLIALQAGAPRTPQEAANAAWIALGVRLGFDGMTVEPHERGECWFTAISRAEA